MLDWPPVCASPQTSGPVSSAALCEPAVHALSLPTPPDQQFLLRGTTTTYRTHRRTVRTETNREKTNHLEPCVMKINSLGAPRGARGVPARFVKRARLLRDLLICPDCIKTPKRCQTQQNTPSLAARCTFAIQKQPLDRHARYCHCMLRAA